MNTRLLITALLAGSCGLTYAQDTTTENSISSVKRDVTVEKSYVPERIDAVKINPAPAKDDYRPEPPAVNYSDWNETEPITAPENPIKSDGYTAEKDSPAREGMAKVGLGFYWQTLGEFYYPLLQVDKYYLDVHVDHHANWGDIRIADGSTPRAMRQRTAADMNFGADLRNCRLETSVDFTYKNYDYYGLCSADLPNSLQGKTLGYLTTGIAVEAASSNSRESFQYQVIGDYHYLGGRNYGEDEHLWKVGGDFSGRLGKGRLGGSLLAEDGVITLSPYYRMQREEWSLYAGGDMYIDCHKGAKRAFTGAANVKGVFGIVPELFYLYAGIGGSYQLNNSARILEECPYISPDWIVDPCYTPVAVNVGIKVNVCRGLLFDVSAGYDLQLDQHYYLNDTLNLPQGEFYNTFITATEPTTHKVTVQAGLHFTRIKNLNLDLTGNYNYWGVSQQAHAWQRPAWIVNFEGSYRFLERWQVGLGYHYEGGRYALVSGESLYMNDIHDLSVKASCKALKWLTVFVEGKNLANVQNDSFYGYRNFGINGLAGVLFLF